MNSTRRFAKGDQVRVTNYCGWTTHSYTGVYTVDKVLNTGFVSLLGVVTTSARIAVLFRESELAPTRYQILKEFYGDR